MAHKDEDWFYAWLVFALLAFCFVVFVALAIGLGPRADHPKRHLDATTSLSGVRCR